MHDGRPTVMAYDEGQVGQERGRRRPIWSEDLFVSWSIGQSIIGSRKRSSLDAHRTQGAKASQEAVEEGGGE